MSTLTDSSLLWHISRASGLVSLFLFTVVTVLGVLTRLNWQPTTIPRFVVQGIHRSSALLSLAFVAIHVASVVADSYVTVSILSVLVPFTSDYSMFWVSFGTVAIDIALAVVITSLLRPFIGVRLWRWVHWSAYLLWPIAIIHGLGVGTDSTNVWILGLYAVEALAFGIATYSRFRKPTRQLQPLGRLQ